MNAKSNAKYYINGKFNYFIIEEEINVKENNKYADIYVFIGIITLLLKNISLSLSKKRLIYC